MSDGQIRQLHKECVTALHSYINEARKTCSALEALEFPLNPNVRLEMLSQRLAENEAQERYQRARRKLFRVAKWISPDEPTSKE